MSEWGELTVLKNDVRALIDFFFRCQVCFVDYTKFVKSDFSS